MRKRELKAQVRRLQARVAELETKYNALWEKEVLPRLRAEAKARGFHSYEAMVAHDIVQSEVRDRFEESTEMWKRFGGGRNA